MRPGSRPAHYRLTDAEQAQIDAEHQRGKEDGYLSVMLLVMAPFFASLTVAALSAFGVL